MELYWRLSLLSLYLLSRGVAPGPFLQFPQNKVVVVEDQHQVSLLCKVANYSTADQVRWTYNNTTISTNRLVTDVGSRGQYSLKGSAIAGEFHLLIQAPRPADAGWYGCEYTKSRDASSIQATPAHRLAYLIVIEKPMCSSNRESAVAGQSVQLVYNLSTTVDWPIIISLVQPGKAKSQVSMPSWNASTVSFLVTVSPVMQEQPIQLVTSFGSLSHLVLTDSPIEKYDHQSPNFSDSCQVPLKVFYFPQHVNVSMPPGPLLVNDRVICSADSNPPADFAWIRLAGQGGDVFIDGRFIIVTKAMAGNNTYLCLVTSTIDSRRRSSYREISFLVSGSGTAASGSPTGHPEVHLSHPLSVTTIAIAVYAALITVACAIIIAVILWKRRPRRKFLPRENLEIDGQEMEQYDEQSVFQKPAPAKLSDSDDPDLGCQYSQVDEGDNKSLIEGAYNTSSDAQSVPSVANVPLLSKRQKVSISPDHVTNISSHQM